MYVTERSSDGAHTIGKAVTLSTSPDAACTARVPNEIAPVWSALAERRAPASVFLTPEWIAVARAHSNDQAVTLCAGDPPYGVASLARSSDVISFAGVELTDEQDVVAAPQDAREAARAVARWMASEHPSRVVVEYVPEDAPTLAAFDEVLSAAGYRVTRERLVTSPRITLAADYESYVQGLGKKERHELRR